MDNEDPTRPTLLVRPRSDESEFVPYGGVPKEIVGAGIARHRETPTTRPGAKTAPWLAAVRFFCCDFAYVANLLQYAFASIPGRAPPSRVLEQGPFTYESPRDPYFASSVDTLWSGRYADSGSSVGAKVTRGVDSTRKGICPREGGTLGHDGGSQVSGCGGYEQDMVARRTREST